MRPHDGARRRPQSPGYDRLSANQGAHEQTLDSAAALILRDVHFLARLIDDLDDERLVATALDAERRPAEPTVAERMPARGDPVDRSAHLGRQKQPRARRIARVELDRRRMRAPHGVE